MVNIICVDTYITQQEYYLCGDFIQNHQSPILAPTQYFILYGIMMIDTTITVNYSRGSIISMNIA